MTTPPPVERTPSVEALVTAYLITHQRHTSSACLCGPLKLGTLHSAHVAEALSRAGLLAESVPVHPSFPIDIPEDGR